ncbi:alpha-2-macroglobulin receptor-associated protein-like isoform X2 [Biomphalaria glabrata]|uniref:Alpha-2-macroglobulin receptor-associated protein-like isoform X2 n=1 Tax=Biomphalaria glabrata TaxID=6526 RepID=A0A9W2ZI93_BIOGL|nr:alpha-2-macroglobulin receptor-associated protein-like isoform X2 [Biomphalaria glabrata]KAI8795061.1 alpha-2-macroglobulin receptor-associated protein [Biomphalaria glabrata]
MFSIASKTVPSVPLVVMLFLYVIVTQLIGFSNCKINKYSEEANAQFLDLSDNNLKEHENPFRMKKVNALWTKAKNRVSGPHLAELFADLKVHDKYELQLKKMKAENSDKDGSYEAMVLKNYLKIIKQYDLENVYFGNDVTSADKRTDVEFTDSKLKSLWNKAQMAGFSAEDLSTLKDEFWHQQMKIQELEFMKSQKNDIPDPADNSVDTNEQVSNIKKSKTEIKDGYLRLEELVSSLPKNDPLFKDSRVHQLWALAKKTNWSEDELNSFKAKLLHFENRLTKQSFYKEQLDMSAQKIESDLKDDNYLDRHRQLEEKHEVIYKNIKKLHTELKTKVTKALKHLEL